MSIQLHIDRNVLVEKEIKSFDNIIRLIDHNKTYRLDDSKFCNKILFCDNKKIIYLQLIKLPQRINKVHYLNFGFLTKSCKTLNDTDEICLENLYESSNEFNHAHDIDEIIQQEEGNEKKYMQAYIRLPMVKHNKKFEVFFQEFLVLCNQFVSALKEIENINSNNEIRLKNIVNKFADGKENIVARFNLALVTQRKALKKLKRAKK